MQAQNHVEACQRARIRINIRVISNRISFNQLSQQFVPENTTPNTRIVGVVATGGVGAIGYSIMSGNVGQAFAIGPNTGLVTVSQPLDFETLSTYTLTVRAESIGTTVRGDINLDITILDINEPHSFLTQCAQTSVGCTFSIDENLSGTALGIFEATDPDSSSSPNGTLTYTTSDINLPFTVDLGNLRTSGPLDRETRDSYSFAVIVRDGCVGGCSITIETNVRVTVNDVNDNPPVFTVNPGTVDLSEDAPQDSIVAQYIATDADIGTNAVIIFSLSPSNIPFTLSGDGILTLTGLIDFETIQSYNITITASNPGGVMPVSTDTTIQIINVNDNTPVFVGEPYSENVVENSPTSTPVLQVMATDADLGSHGYVRYSITGGNFNDSFMISPTTGAITVRNNIDRETMSSFSLVVVARDLGLPQSRRVTTTVSVSVTDVNDNPPIFQPDFYTVQLREDLPGGEDVVQVLASDADEPNTPNSEIRYTIRSGNMENRFAINNSSGLIKIKNMLDFETTPSYSLVIEGKDRGSPVMTGMATVNVTVINVNENPPNLTSDQVVGLSEAAPVNTLVAVFQALDPDQMPVTFSLVGGNTEGKFTIGNSTGEISLIESLDFETTTMYLLRIRASDGQQSAEATLTVVVLDENEFSPMFSGPTAFSIVEERQGGDTVGTVMAMDGDRNAVVSYFFAQQDSTTNLFILNAQTGEITTRDMLDREVLTQIFVPSQSTATLLVYARDNGSPSRQTQRAFTVTLLDINDNPPIFSDSSYSSMLMENLPAGQNVFQVVAMDIDLGTNAAISYSFTLTGDASNTNLFMIDPSTGAITTTSSLDCELRASYLFLITATDMGSIRMNATATGNLTVIDVNDNSPIFDPTVYRMSVSEATVRESTILTVRATDMDKGLNGEVEYMVDSSIDFTLSLESSVVRTRFNIGLKTGILINLNEFDFESAPQINLTIFANDRGIPQMSSFALVILDIVNVDEQRPIFLSITCDSFVREDIGIGSDVTQCMAVDRDTIAMGGQLPITYSLQSPSAFFSINPDTAQIITTALLDREETPVHIVTVVAMDLVGMANTRCVVIRLFDVNDNPPMFSSTPYRFPFTTADTQTVSQFFTVSAQDLDSGENGTFSFAIGNVERLSNTETSVGVIATDMGSPQLSSTATVSITFEEPCQLQEYVIAASSGELFVSLLCSVQVTPQVLPIVLDDINSFSCSIVSNTPVTYQWLHNATVITNPQVVGSQAAGTGVSLTLSNVGFSDAGEYACRATSEAGSLQSSGNTVSILGR